MSAKVKPIPDGFHTATPYLRVRGAAAALDFYKKAFGAEEVMRMTGPDGKTLMHGEFRIGDSIIMIGDEFPQMNIIGPVTLGNTTVGIHLYVEDADKAIARAVSAGATVTMPAQNMFWGDRFGKIKDPFGHEWTIATKVEDVPPDVLARRTEKAAKEMCSN